jgi:hypothetical protein
MTPPSDVNESAPRASHAFITGEGPHMQPHNDSGSKLEASRQTPMAPGAAGYDEWLLDMSIEETFPASDAMLPVRPGSNLSMRQSAG